MKKVLIAMDNETLLSQIKKCGKYLTYGYDIDNKENVLEYLSKNVVDVIVTKDTLNGDIEFKEYIREIRKRQETIKIVVVIAALTEDIKGFLLANEVNNIIEGECVAFSKILEMIDSKSGIIEKMKTQKNVIKQSPKITTKQKICVFGTSGAGKSYISSILAHHISKKYKLNTLLIDMDLQNAAVDIYNNLTNATNSLDCLMEEIDNDTFNRESLLDYISRGEKNNKLSFITNNVGVYECQNRLSKKYYEKLYTEAEKNYDTIIIDMPSTPFLDVVPFSLMQADKILFVLNPNFISVRQAIKYIDLMVNVWQIDKEKIFLIINKTTENSLTLKQVKAMLRDYTVLLKLEETRNVEKIVNGLANITGEEIIDTDELTKMLNIDDCVQRVKGEEKTSAYKCIQNCFGRKENKKDTK